jgi:hypothetical protein
MIQPVIGSWFPLVIHAVLERFKMAPVFSWPSLRPKQALKNPDRYLGSLPRRPKFTIGKTKGGTARSLQ